MIARRSLQALLRGNDKKWGVASITTLLTPRHGSSAMATTESSESSQHCVFSRVTSDHEIRSNTAWITNSSGQGSRTTHTNWDNNRKLSTSTSRRFLSTSAVQAPPQSPLSQQGHPPSDLNEEMAHGVQEATQLFIKHGLGKQALTFLGQRAPPEGDTSTLVARWQEMMQTYLGCQLHVLGGMGYTTDERGIALYNYQLAQLMSTADPSTQEKLRISSRDTWRTVLSLAFDVSHDELAEHGELSVVEAREIMYKVSQHIMSPAVLEKVANKIGNLEMSNATKQEEIAIKHTMVQQVLIKDVYCGDGGVDGSNSKSLVEETGFGSGERGYVKLQSAMAEYQSDPLVAQYMGGAMMQILRVAGLEEATREMAENMRADAQKK
jgi:hypothetical protein